MRLIDADALYEKVQHDEELARNRVLDTESTLPYPNNLNPSYTRYVAQMDERTRLKHMVADAPTVEPEPHWIPCSERLPKDGRQVLVYARSVHYALAKYDEMREADGSYKKQWVTFDAWKPFYTVKDVIAWMPLPPAYKPEEESEWIKLKSKETQMEIPE